jgi:cellulose synthase operon protein YhjQ
MSEITPPQDVAALLSHTQLTKYKVFSQDRRVVGSSLDGNSGEALAAPADGNFMNSSPDTPGLEFVRQQSPRWSLLQDLGQESEQAPVRGDLHELRVPTFAICSTGGGAGKTTVSSTFGRALSMTGDNILMIHGALQPSAPLHFGAQLAQAGRLRTFVAPLRNQGTVHMLSHEYDDGSRQNEEGGAWLLREVNSLQNEIDHCIVEISAPRGQEAQIMKLARVCLVVLTPDVNSVMALAPFRRLSEHAIRPGSPQKQPNVYFLINKFDPTSAFHAEVRQNLRLQLGARLLPFCIRRNDVIAEALAAGMTVLDYAPNSAPAEDFLRLSAWARESAFSPRAIGAI